MLALRDLSTAFYAHIFVSNTCLKKVTRHDTGVKLKVCQKWHTFWCVRGIQVFLCQTLVLKNDTTWHRCQIEGVSKVTHIWCVRENNTSMSKMTHFCVKHLSQKMTQHDTDVKLKVCQKYWHTFGVYGEYKCVKNDRFFGQTLVPKKTRHDTDVKLKVFQKWHTLVCHYKCVEFIVCQKWHSERVSNQPKD